MIKNNSNFATTIVILMFYFFVNAQEKPSQKALLWEISKNGQSKKSYIYGTMHVSGKIAYHLGEEFFDALNSADAIALESNPIIWLDEIFESDGADEYIGRFAIATQTYKGFYKESFKLEKLDNKEWGQELSENHFLTNWMLYRENRAKSDFEEETFLDLFIYQAGRKNNKPVYSLENFKETRKLANLSRIPDVETKETPSWYKELLKEKRLIDLIEDAYRNQDIDLMDSLQRESASTNYMKYLLYERNYFMADKIDSLLNTNISLFVGIGAAHLPHTEGVLNLLKNKGYTLTPIKPTITNKAKQEKERLSALKYPVSLNHSFVSELFSMKIPNKIYETPSRGNKREFFAPELTNGTFYTVKELSTFSYFKDENQTDYLHKLDSLLFENIPGKIISKTTLIKDGYQGLDIVNRTKSGDFQRYQIFVTPLKIFIFKMGGKDEYVKTQSQPFFNSISLSKPNEEWQTISSIKKDFSVYVPSYYDIKYNTHVTSLYGHPELEAFDPKNNTYFYIKRASLHDFVYIEEDRFELFRIMDKFAKQFDIDSVFDKEIITKTSNPTATGWATTKKTKTLHFQVVIKGAYYYLISSLSETKEKNDAFFNSFQLNDFVYLFPFETKTDSTLQFSVNSNYLKPTAISQLYEKSRQEKREKNQKEDETYLTKNKSEIYFSENFERIKVDYLKFHTYSSYENLDSLWDRQLVNFTKDKSLKVFFKNKYQHADTNFLDITFTDTNSCRTIYKKYIQFDNVLYCITANLDTLNTKSTYVSQFLNTFKPFTLNEKQLSVLSDKAQLFFDVLDKGDSANKEIAYKSILTHLKFQNQHSEKLMEIIQNHSFPAQHIASKAQLIKDLGKTQNPKVVPFLSQLYKQMEDTALYQVAILRALANQKTKTATTAFVQLLELDIPLGNSKDAFRYIFNQFDDSLELTKHLFPKLLDFTFVPEYKNPIYELLSLALDSNALAPKTIKKHYSQVLREAKMVLKSQISYEQSELAKSQKRSSYYYTSYLNKGNYDIVMYSSMLMPFYKDKNVTAYFHKLALVNDYIVKTDIACDMIKHKIPLNKVSWYALAQDPINYAYVYEKLKFINRLDLFPNELISQESMAISLLYENDFNFKTDSCVFLKKERIEKNGEDGFVYFYKSKSQDDEKWSLDYVGVQPLDSKKLDPYYEFKKTGIAIDKGKNIDDLIAEQMAILKIADRKRADEKSNNYGYGGYDFFDF